MVQDEEGKIGFNLVELVGSIVESSRPPLLASIIATIVSILACIVSIISISVT